MARSATALLRDLMTVPAHRLGPRAAIWPPLLRALPSLLKSDGKRVLDAVSRVDVMPALQDLAAGNIGRLRFTGAPVDGERLERALITLWLGLAGHPGLSKPLVLAGPFQAHVVDPHAPRVLAFGDVRALAATDKGIIVLGHTGQVPTGQCVVTELPTYERTVLVTDALTAPVPATAEQVRQALARISASLPGGRLERVCIGDGLAACGEARRAEASPADLVASAQSAFVRLALRSEPVLEPLGYAVRQRQRIGPDELLARLCGDVVALPWRENRTEAVQTIQRDLADLETIAIPTTEAEALLAAIHDSIAAAAPLATSPRALLVNVDADDFVYSFQFGQAIERRCNERGMRVDRIFIDYQTQRDLAGEMGAWDLAPLADGIEVVIASEQDGVLPKVVPCLALRRYELAVINTRPRLFYDLLEAGLLQVPTLVWDRHLHDGLKEEYQRRQAVADRAPDLPIRIWSLQGGSGEELTRGNQNLFDAGLACVKVRPWPLDLQYFRAVVPRQPNLLFAGGDSGRDWPLFVEAVRDVPYDIHLVTRQVPPGLPPNVRVDGRLTLWRFRDAMAAASVIAIPVRPGFGASGVTVLPMAMALGVAAVITRTSWVEQYVTDGVEALLVPAGDASAFRDALVRLHSEPELRERLVLNARRRVESLCDLDAFTREMFATLG